MKGLGQDGNEMRRLGRMPDIYISEYTIIRGTQYRPQIVGLLLSGHPQKGPPIYGNSHTYIYIYIYIHTCIAMCINT